MLHFTIVFKKRQKLLGENSREDSTKQRREKGIREIQALQSPLHGGQEGCLMVPQQKREQWEMKPGQFKTVLCRTMNTATM